MRRLIGACALALLMGCGGSGGGTAQHPDASGTAGDAGTTGAAGTTGGAGTTGAAGAGVAGTTGAGGTGGAGGEAGTGGIVDANADDAVDAASDVGSDTVADAGGEPEAAAPRLVTVAFTGKVVTVAQAPDAGMPLGFDSTVRLAPVSGSFTYDLRIFDSEPADPLRGKYQHDGTSAFSFAIKGHTVAGSAKALVETEDLNPDTFRFLDGPQADTIVRTMKLDGADAPALKLVIAITDGAGAMLTSDALPDPFPTIDIANKNNFNISHTFSLQDNGGTLLMQLDSLVNQ
jgi:hypothetical protein